MYGKSLSCIPPEEPSLGNYLSHQGKKYFLNNVKLCLSDTKVNFYKASQQKQKTPKLLKTSMAYFLMFNKLSLGSAVNAFKRCLTVINAFHLIKEPLEI